LASLSSRPAAMLLHRLRTEAAAAEVVHNLALWSNSSWQTCAPACTGTSSLRGGMELHAVATILHDRRLLSQPMRAPPEHLHHTSRVATSFSC
jgi:hypothetical protein